MRNGDSRPVHRPSTPLPSLDLLTPPPREVEPIDTFALEQMARLVEARLADFRIKADVVNYSPGPVITRFELNLAPGVKAARISNPVARSGAFIVDRGGTRGRSHSGQTVCRAGVTQQKTSNRLSTRSVG
ncbi:DNA translocase FtsK [Citrobacter freundii]|nr:DNA translocase FtsK [Citrobacter freundii]